MEQLFRHITSQEMSQNMRLVPTIKKGNSFKKIVVLFISTFLIKMESEFMKRTKQNAIHSKLVEKMVMLSIES